MTLKYERVGKEKLIRNYLINKGEFGMLIAPSPTDAFAMSLAMSASSTETYKFRDDAKMPLLKNVLYIDTVSDLMQLKAEHEKANKRNKVNYPNNFSIIIRDGCETKTNLSKNKTFKPQFHRDIINILKVPAFGKNVKCIFVMLDTVLHRPKEFNDEQRNSFLDLVQRLKAKGITLVLVSRHVDSDESDFGVPMDFVIKLDPDINYFDINKFNILR